MYSDTVFFLGNFSKSMEILSKITFGLGASSASLIFFFTLGYGAKLVSPYLDNPSHFQNLNLYKFLNQLLWFLSFITLLE